MSAPGLLEVIATVDADYYRRTNPDVETFDITPALHYRRFGWVEGRNPNAWFDTTWYLEEHSDVAALGIDPLEHYVRWGWHEGRHSHPSATVRREVAEAASFDPSRCPLLVLLAHRAAQPN